MTASVLAPAFMQRGSDDIEIVSAGGGVPMKMTLPATAPAVAGSTGLVTGARGAVRGRLAAAAGGCRQRKSECRESQSGRSDAHAGPLLRETGNYPTSRCA